MHHLVRSRLRDVSLLLVLSLAGCANSGADGHLVPHTVVADLNLPRFALADGRLVHLRTFGDPAAPVVVVLHGGPGGDHRDYLHLEAWANRFFVVLWDQRGTGLSERVPDEELDGPTYLGDLDFLGETFSPGRPVHLVGHSWGGAYATYYAQQFPARVASLVLVEPGALDATAARRANVVSANFGATGFQEFLNATDYLLPDTDARADYFYLIALAGMKEDVELLGYDFWRLGYRANLGINRWQGNFDGSYSFDFTTGLDAFEGQVLFVTGTSEGRLGHEFQTSQQVPRFARARVLQLPDASHSELLRRPESLDSIYAFLREAR
ncbi:MAG: alpha/beta hydrolase [Myxococcales bacterium]|nr:alpha/beta hydrolase [Myxococcales bacterium]